MDAVEQARQLAYEQRLTEKAEPAIDTFSPFRVADDLRPPLVRGTSAHEEDKRRERMDTLELLALSSPVLNKHHEDYVKPTTCDVEERLYDSLLNQVEKVLRKSYDSLLRPGQAPRRKT